MRMNGSTGVMSLLERSCEELKGLGVCARGIQIVSPSSTTPMTSLPWEIMVLDLSCQLMKTQPLPSTAKFGSVFPRIRQRSHTYLAKTTPRISRFPRPQERANFCHHWAKTMCVSLVLLVERTLKTANLPDNRPQRMIVQRMNSRVNHPTKIEEMIQLWTLMRQPRLLLTSPQVQYCSLSLVEMLVAKQIDPNYRGRLPLLPLPRPRQVLYCSLLPMEALTAKQIDPICRGCLLPLLLPLAPQGPNFALMIMEAPAAKQNDSGCIECLPTLLLPILSQIVMFSMFLTPASRTSFENSKCKACPLVQLLLTTAEDLNFSLVLLQALTRKWESSNRGVRILVQPLLGRPRIFNFGLAPVLALTADQIGLNCRECLLGQSESCSILAQLLPDPPQIFCFSLAPTQALIAKQKGFNCRGCLLGLTEACVLAQPIRVIPLKPDCSLAPMQA